ncbi:MAG: cytochrome c biogenesis protein CcsA [Polyangiaceae bacterium]
MLNVVLMYSSLVGGVLLYAAASVFFFVGVARSSARPVGQAAALGGPESRRVVTPAQRLPPFLLAAGASLHAVYVCAASFVLHVCPVGSVHFILSLIGVLATFIYLAARMALVRARAKSGDVGAKSATSRENLDALGLILGPLGLAFLLGTYFLVAHPVSGPILGAPFITLHVLVNLLGIALFVLAGASATLYLVQEGRLKNKRLGKMKNLPALDTLDRAEHRFLIGGFPLLTVGILTGTFWSHQLEFGNATQVMRLVFGYATWLLIAAVLVLRAAAGWRGRRSAYGTIAGVCCALSVLVIYLTRPAPPDASSADASAARAARGESAHP